jgi:DNA-directed RNA polymerase specialized sigma24 family protein
MLGSIHRFSKKDSGEFGGWVRRISQRRIADYFRSRQDGIAGSDVLRQIPSRAEIRDIMENESQLVSLDAISDERMLRTFLQAQLEFKEPVWNAFWMVTVEGKSVAETALELGTTKNIVYLSKSRVKRRLQQIFNTVDYSD